MYVAKSALCIPHSGDFEDQIAEKCDFEVSQVGSFEPNGSSTTKHAPPPWLFSQ
jgi:hypothetical protein